MNQTFYIIKRGSKCSIVEYHPNKKRIYSLTTQFPITFNKNELVESESNNKMLVFNKKLQTFFVKLNDVEIIKR